MDSPSSHPQKPSSDDSSTKTTSSEPSSETSTAVADSYTWLDLAKEVGKEFGKTLNDKQADYMLWEHTGFPSFFSGDPIEQCREQLRAAFRRVDL